MTVEILDIHDVEGFVAATINRFCAPTRDRGRIELSADEREDLSAEGVAILYKLHQQYRPRLAGYDQDGRFSGYAAQFLPRKLGDAWHRLHDEHQLRAQPEGGRRWTYGEKAVSLEALTAENPDRHSLMATHPDSTNVESRLRTALKERSDRRLDMGVKVGMVLAEGGTVADASQILGLTAIQAREYVQEIQTVAHRLQGGDSV